MDSSGTVEYFVYILRCKDGTLYAGSTQDLEKRVHAHNSLKSGAKYTRARRPVEMVYSERCKTLPEARSREAAIKRLTRKEKMALITSCLS